MMQLPVAQQMLCQGRHPTLCPSQKARLLLLTLGLLVMSHERGIITKTARRLKPDDQTKPTVGTSACILISLSPALRY